MSTPLDWRMALQEWLKNNSKTMPNNLIEKRQEFLSRFPRDKIGELTLEQYTLGHDGFKDSFCYWLEWETYELGSVRGGTSAKWGVWYSESDGTWRYNKEYQNAQEALSKIKQGLENLFTAVENGQYSQLDKIGNSQLGPNRNSLRAKPLYLYYPDQFLPISNPTHLANILSYFGQEPVKGLHARNRQLLSCLRSLPEFDGFDSRQMMRFLYGYNLNEKTVTFKNQDALQKAIKAFARFANTPNYKKEEYNYKAELLDSLREVLAVVAEGDPQESQIALQQWTQQYRESLNNLTSWQETDTFNKYLNAVPAAQIQTLLQALIDDDGDLGERIDSFRLDFESDLENYAKQKGDIHLGFISILLMGSNTEKYIIYRSTPIYKACEDWGGPELIGGHRNDGAKYSQYLTLIPPLQSQLTISLDRPADLIDVYTLIWFNYESYYDIFRVEHGKSLNAVEERPFLRHIIQVTKRTRNIILYGPPGTGKTYWARQFGQRFGKDRMRFVTFHQSFAYEDFVEGIKPESVKGHIHYEVIRGIFRDLCQLAISDSDNQYLLIIDEINRANIAKVFGELITLIEDDKRLGEENELSIELPYSRDTFGVPANLFIFGTMNTADRSIALLDIALRRRFTFIEVEPNIELLENEFIEDLSLSALLQQLNVRVTLLLDKDHQIGHSYFLGIESLADLRFVWEHRIVPLLQEYFYNDGERLQAVLGQDFVGFAESDQKTREALDRWYDAELRQYRLLELTDEEFLTALKKLANVSG